MKKLYDNLEKPISLMHRDIRELPSALQSAPFVDLYEKYDTTLKSLQNEPIDSKKSVEPDRKNALNEIAKAAIGSALSTLVTTNLGVPLDLENAGKIATVALSASDLLMQHQATKKNKTLIELMANPLPKLTNAFIKGLSQRSKALKKTIILVLDTYEKAEANCQGVDNWLWRTLLANTDIQNHSIRIVMAGRDNLPHVGWNKISNLIYPCNLERFDLEQTREYLQKWEISSEPELIFRVTRGLPKYLQWIRERQVRGINVDFSKGSKEIASLLLEDFTSSQQQIIKLAAFCHWFDKPLIDHLIKSQNIPLDSEADKNCNWFEWLTETYFVELVKGKYRFDDVARDVFRQQVYLKDSKQFDDIHYSLSLYFEAQSNCEIASDCSPPNKYNNDDWCKCISESLYHALFSKHGDNQLNFLTHLFASLYCNRNDLSVGVVEMVTSEIDLNSDDFQDSLLSKTTKDFLKTIAPIAKYGLTILSIDNVDSSVLGVNDVSKNEIDKALVVIFSKLEQMQGLAKFVILLCKSKHCPITQKLDWLNKAKSIADKISTDRDLDFSANLFLWSLGSSFYQQGFHKEAIAAYDRALEFKLDLHEAWCNRGIVLDNLGRYKEAISAYDRALEFKPDLYEAWNNRGGALVNLGRCEEAIASFNKALEFKSDLPQAWQNRSIALDNLGRYEEAIASCDKAVAINPDYYQAWLERGYCFEKLGQYEESRKSHSEAVRIKPDYAEGWYNQGVQLGNLGRYEEAIASFDRALEFKPDYHAAWNNRGSALDRLGRNEEAIDSFDRALDKPDYHAAWYNRGIVLGNLCRYEEAITSYEKALEFKPDDPNPYFNKACAYSLQNQIELALENLQKAIQLNPEKYREMAKTDSEFDNIRHDPRFQALIQ